MYDVMVTSGGMGEGHIPTNALQDMIRIVKKGITSSSSYFSFLIKSFIYFILTNQFGLNQFKPTLHTINYSLIGSPFK